MYRRFATTVLLAWTLLVAFFAGAASTDSALAALVVGADTPPQVVPAAPLHATPRTTQPPLRFTLVNVSAGVVVHAWPGGPSTGTAASHTPLGAPSWLWATTTSSNGAWAKVVLPWHPNGSTGWIRLSGVPIVRSPYWVRADVSARRVVLMSGRHPMASFPAAVGASSSPTPTGRFSVTDLVATGDPGGPFGWYAFGLSGHQPNLPPGWSGGDQLAIHGTNDPASIGTPASAGCLRVSSHALTVLKYYLRLGTPVVIQP